MTTDIYIIPESIQAEKTILGTIMLDNAVMDEAVEELGNGEALYSSRHRIIYRGMLRLREQGLPIDGTTLHEFLVASGELESAGGFSYLASLIDGVPRTDSIEYYTRIVKRKAQVRGIMKAASRIVSLCQDEPDEPGLIADVQRIFWEACAENVSTGFEHILEVTNRYLGKVEQLMGQDDAITGMPTGYDEFDFRTLGLQRTDLVILAARPSRGKTTLSWNIAENVAKAGYGVAYFSIEMANERLAEKKISREIKMDSFRLRSGRIELSDLLRAGDVLNTLGSQRLFLCDEPRLTAMELKAKAQRIKREHGLDLIVVDYLQLMRGDGRREKLEIVGQNADDLKAIAKELDVCVLALSQLNREVEKRGGPPRLSDLGESGQIERAADVITFVYPLPDDLPDSHIAHLLMEKNRNGPTGQFDLVYFKAQNRFENAMR